MTREPSFNPELNQILEDTEPQRNECQVQIPQNILPGDISDPNFTNTMCTESHKLVGGDILHYEPNQTKKIISPTSQD